MDEVWKIERRLWLEGVDAYAAHLAEDCLMAFGPMGLMQKPQVIESLRDAPRWTSLELSDRSIVMPADTVAVILGYKAEARRDGGDPYRALCTSTYLVIAGELRLVQHQQTPL